MKPAFAGHFDGAECIDNSSTPQETWVWRLVKGPDKFAVTTAGVDVCSNVEVARGLTRKDAAKIAGPLFKDERVFSVSLQLLPPEGDWCLKDDHAVIAEARSKSIDGSLRGVRKQ